MQTKFGGYIGQGCPSEFFLNSDREYRPAAMSICAIVPGPYLSYCGTLEVSTLHNDCL